MDDRFVECGVRYSRRRPSRTRGVWRRAYRFLDGTDTGPVDACRRCLAVYALCAMLLATGTLLTETLVARHRLGRAGGYRTLAARDWIEALGTNGLHHLVASRPPNRSKGQRRIR